MVSTARLWSRPVVGRTFVGGALAMLCALASAQTPESPSLWREVLGVDGLNPQAPRFTRPHMPGLRVTKDGRVGVMVEGGLGVVIHGTAPGFALMIPEKLSEPFLLSQPGAHTMSSVRWSYLANNPDPWFLRDQFAPGSDGIVHACLWDDTPPVSRSGLDFYELKLLVTSRTDIDKPNMKWRSQLHMTPVGVVVANPKTSLAQIVAVNRVGPTVNSPLLDFEAGFEPVIAGDGRLLVLRVAKWQGLHWTDPNTQAPRVNGTDIAYGYYPSGPTVDVTQWTNLIPITFAPYDQRINNKFGFAMAPFRDPEGNLIPAGKDIGGSYPWIDRDAKNLFIETIGDRAKFYYSASSQASRYPAFTLPGDLSYSHAEDSGGTHQGVSFVGLWSHGKLVMIDNLNNDIDYAMGNSDQPQTRQVELYDASRAADPGHARLTMGYGRATTRMPAGENDNGNIIDSLEARFTYRKHFKPIGLHDVVWPLTNGKQTDELGFDGSLDPDAFLVASMAGSLTYVDTRWALAHFDYHDGWQHPHGPFNKPIRLQNAASGARWNVPAYGQSHGVSRLEPAANGGIRGKGFWLTGQNGIEFSIPAQTPAQRVRDADWYVGMFVDCRHDDDQSERSVLTFPDGSSLRLYGRRQVVYADAAGVAVHRITMPIVVGGTMGDLLPYRGWAHLGCQISEAGSRIDFHLNGMLFDRWRDPSRTLFQLNSGVLTVGKPQSSNTTGMTGWIDELNIHAHTFDPETLCNLAGGTLVGLDAAYNGDWRTQFADRFPDWVHAEISAELINRGETAYPRYASFHRYDQDHAARVDNIPQQTYSLRESMQFPEGPLFHNAPRPQSLQNSFCTSCHFEGGRLGLGLNALAYDPSKMAAQDPRRQPMQPAALIHGTIPAGLVDTVTPPQPLVDQAAPDQGLPIDVWMMPTYYGPAKVESFTVVDPTTGDDLFPLTPHMVLDPKKLGLTSVSIRANLNTAQGSVMHAWNTQQAPTTSVPPHAQTVSLTPGTHTVTATPASGQLVSRTFSVPAPGVRIIANFRSDFRPGSPAANWHYAWNAAGAVTSSAPYRSLNWSPTLRRYTARGLSLPEPALAYGALNGFGGHPGPSLSQPGLGRDLFVLAGYEVQASGTYRVQNATVQTSGTVSDGVQIIVLVRGPNSVTVHYDQAAPAGAPFTIPMQRLTNLTAGQIIYVAIGPNDKDWADSFALDFDIAVE